MDDELGGCAVVDGNNLCVVVTREERQAAWQAFSVRDHDEARLEKYRSVQADGELSGVSVARVPTALGPRGSVDLAARRVRIAQLDALLRNLR